MANTAVNELFDLLKDMRCTNVSNRGLKVAVHEDWIRRLEKAYNELNQELPGLRQKAAQADELSASPTLVKEVAAQIRQGKGR